MPVKKSRRRSKDASGETRARFCIKGERIGTEFAENQPTSSAAKSDDGNYTTANETTIRYKDSPHEDVSVINAQEHNWKEFLFLYSRTKDVCNLPGTIRSTLKE